MPAFLLALAFGIFGAWELEFTGFVLGALGGYLLGAVLSLRRDVAAIRAGVQPSPPAVPTTTPTVEPWPATETPKAEEAVEPASPRTEHAAVPPADRKPSPIEALIVRAFAAVKQFLTTGNVVARVGVIVLFFGVAFLLRYAYERDLVSVELRLLGAAILGVGLTVVGWRFRHRADTFGVILQGAGVGVLYLTIFGAARLYDLLPVSAAFGLMVVLVAASSVLAVLQNAQALAIFAMSGGFLAPVLMSTGGGSHVALFSYYALLNAGILAMAWFRYWRWLNWVGFVFTFVIAAAWGYRYYKPEFFATVEPFLILFFVYYVAVTLLFGRRAEPELRGIVDGTLVFGTPIVAFGLQAGLVRDIEFGLAYSALGAALIYIVLARWLNARAAFSELLGRSFLALGVVFATLTLPFAFDDQRWTAASWALEGAGLVWVGFRQQQWLPRAFGGLLALAAGVAFVYGAFSIDTEPRLILNGTYFGTLMIALGGGFTAYLCAQYNEMLHRYEQPLGWVFIVWAALWWLAGGLHEISSFHPGWYEQFTYHRVHEHLYVLFVAVSGAMVTAIARWRDWREVRMLGFMVLPYASLMAGVLGLDWRGESPLTDLGFLAWPAAIAATVWHLKETDWLPKLRAWWHALVWWLAVMLLAWTVAAIIETALPRSVWQAVSWGVIPAALTLALLRMQSSPHWPFASHWESHFGLGVLPMAAYLGFWVLITALLEGDPAPLPYVALVNPLELAQIGVVVALLWWLAGLRGALAPFATLLQAGLGLLGFVWLNLTAARAVHFYAGVPHLWQVMSESPVYQATLSILWTLTALVLMAVGARARLRAAWIAGAVLLGLVILKLFSVDLANLDVVARIVSFMTVGVLMLLIGYLAPIPPARREEATTP